MKKIISLFIVLAMVACMGITSFAATEGLHITLTVDKPELTVGSGTQEVLVTLSFVADSDTVISSVQTGFNFGELTIVSGSYDDSVLVASIPRGDAINEAAGAYTYMDMANWSTPTWTAGSVYSVTAKVSVDTATAATYTIGVDGSTDALTNDYVTTAINGGKDATATITVKAAGHEYENVDTKIADLVADTTPLVAEDGTEFTNVAKYTGSFNLGNIKAGLTGEGEELLKVGFKKNDGVADTFSSIAISGTGTVQYSFLFYGIEDASVLDIDTYYTAKRIKATN